MPSERGCRLARVLWILAVVYVASGLAAGARAQGAAPFQPTFLPGLEVRRATGAIRIDGDLDDPGWIGAAVADGFTQHSPGDLLEPPVHSEAWVTYDDENLYVALIAADDPGEVRVSWCERDAIFRDDYFGIMLETYGDLAWGYEFFVNPYGIQGDLRVNSDGSEEIGFDLIWQSRGRITPDGYQVELAIPFASLRFPDRAEQTWRFNVWRDHQREVRRRYTWAAIDRDISCWMCQWGTLTGVSDITPGRNIDLIASGVGYQTYRREPPHDPHGPFEREDPEGRLSLNARYGITSSASVEVAVNPDFSQIESDAGQIDVNSTFALFYPERRPFFQEGSDLYGTWIDAIYTRSINDPQAAVKLTGTFGRYAVLYLLARDRNSPVLLPGEERSYRPLARNAIHDVASYTNIVRLRRTLLENSYVGFLATDRRFDERFDGSGSTAGIDGRIRFHPTTQLEFQAVASHTEEPNDTTLTAGINSIVFDRAGHTYGFDGETFSGHALYASLERETSHWSNDLDFWEYSPAFRTANGFTRQNHYRQVIYANSVYFRPNRDLLVEWGQNLNLGRRWNYDGEFKSDWIDASLWTSFVTQTHVATGVEFSREAYGGQRFDNLLAAWIDVDSHPSEWGEGGFYVRRGRTIYRTASDPRTANDWVAEAWISLKPHARMRIQPSFSYYQLAERRGGATIFDGYIARTRITFQFTRELFLRLITQYDDFDRALDLEPLLTYRLNPFTVLYLGANSRQVEFPAGAGAGDRPDAAGLPADRWKPTQRQYFVKVQYLLQL